MREARIILQPVRLIGDRLAPLVDSSPLLHNWTSLRRLFARWPRFLYNARLMFHPYTYVGWTRTKGAFLFQNEDLSNSAESLLAKDPKFATSVESVFLITEALWGSKISEKEAIANEP